MKTLFTLLPFILAFASCKIIVDPEPVLVEKQACSILTAHYPEFWTESLQIFTKQDEISSIYLTKGPIHDLLIKYQATITGNGDLKEVQLIRDWYQGDLIESDTENYVIKSAALGKVFEFDTNYKLVFNNENLTDSILAPIPDGFYDCEFKQVWEGDNVVSRLEYPLNRFVEGGHELTWIFIAGITTYTYLPLENSSLFQLYDSYVDKFPKNGVSLSGTICPAEILSILTGKNHNLMDKIYIENHYLGLMKSRVSEEFQRNDTLSCDYTFDAFDRPIYIKYLKENQEICREEYITYY